MPQIPGRGGLGNVAPQTTPYNERAMPSSGAAELGATVANIGAQLLQDDRQRAALAAREAKQAAQEAEAARKAADRADALGEMHAATDDLAALNQEFSDKIQSGELDKTKAGEEWATAARDRIGTALQQAPGEHRGTLQRDLEHRLRLGAINVSKAVTRRDQQDVRTGIDQTVEYASRQYMDNPAQADRTVAETFKALGPHSGLAPDVLAKAEQVYKERSRLAKGAALITAAQHDNATLDMVAKALAGDEFAPLDPQQRQQLEGQIETLKYRNEQRAKAELERLDRARERQLKEAEAAWNVMQKLSYEGALNSTLAEELHRKTIGTPFEIGIRESLAVQRQTGSIASKSPQVVQATLDAVNAKIMKDGVTEELVQVRDRINKVHDGQVAAIKGDGVLRAAGKYGAADPPPPLDFSAGLPSLMKQLADRAPTVEQASQWAGKTEFLYPDEAAKLADALKALPAKERAAAVVGFSRAFGPAGAAGLAAQIDAKDRGMALAVTSNPTQGGAYRAEMILRGQQAKADGTSTKGEKVPDVAANLWRTQAATALDGVFANAATEKSARDAAELVMHGIASENGGRLTKEDMDTAIGMAVGGSLIKGRGRTLGGDLATSRRAALPVPEGVTEDILDKRLRSVQPHELWPQLIDKQKAAAGEIQNLSKATVNVALPDGGYGPMPVAEFLKSLPGQELGPVSPGRYAVIVNGKYVVNDRGRPIVIGIDPAVTGAPQ